MSLLEVLTAPFDVLMDMVGARAESMRRSTIDSPSQAAPSPSKYPNHTANGAKLIEIGF